MVDCEEEKVDREKINIGYMLRLLELSMSWLVGWLVRIKEDDVVANVNDGVIVNNANDD